MGLLSTALAALHLGAWSGATAYIAGQIVTSGGSSYICVLAHTNHVPPNATYWAVLADKGSPGSAGTSGSILHSLFTSGVDSIAASSTRYGTFGWDDDTAGNFWISSGSEAQRKMIIPKAGTLSDFVVNMTGAQPASGSLTLTIRKNAVDTALQIVIALSSAAGVYADHTNTVAVAAGDLISIKGVNAATVASGVMQQVACIFTTS